MSIISFVAGSMIGFAIGLAMNPESIPEIIKAIKDYKKENNNDK